MKKIVHRSGDRGYANHGWLKTYHSFSFASYHNPAKVRFGLLRVLNDDTVAAGKGFGTHPHDNMEIVTIPLRGELAHKDNMGTAEVIRKNEVQIMSAGTGITHSEYNHSRTQEVELLQIWVFPKVDDIQPRYEQKVFNPAERKDRFQVLVSPDKTEGALWINQDAWFSMAEGTEGSVLNYTINKEGNGVYLFLISGSVEVAGETLKDRDAVGIYETDRIDIKVLNNASILLIEVPMDGGGL